MTSVMAAVIQMSGTRTSFSDAPQVIERYRQTLPGLCNSVVAVVVTNRSFVKNKNIVYGTENLAVTAVSVGHEV